MDTGIYKKLRAAFVADEINYQEQPLLETDVLEEGWYTIPPVNNPPIEGQPITFTYEGNPNWYIDLDGSRVEFRMKVTKADNSNLPNDVGIATVNMVAHAAFRSCITQIQGVDVSPTDTHYAHRQNIAHQITFTPTMNKHVSAVFEGWEPDAPVQEVNAPRDQNTGWLARKTKLANSKVVTYVIQPCDGMWMQGHDLPPRFDLKLTFERTSNAFALMERIADADTPSENYKLAITHAELHLKYKVMQQKAYLEHRAMLASPAGMVFHLKNGQMKLFSIPKACSTHTIQGVYSGLLPPMIVMAMVNSEAFNGTVRTNPFYYRHFDTESIDLRVNGKMCKGQVVRPQFDDGARKNYLWEYFQMLHTLGFAGKEALDINLEQWAAACNFWVFETAPFAAQLDVLQTVGGIDLEIRFAKVTPEPITLIALGQKYETVRLRDNRTVEYYRDVS